MNESKELINKSDEVVGVLMKFIELNTYKAKPILKKHVGDKSGGYVDNYTDASQWLDLFTQQFFDKIFPIIDCVLIIFV